MHACPRAGIAIAAALLASCSGRPPSHPRPPPLEREGDAPYDLADDRDLSARHAELTAMPLEAEGRGALRAKLATEYARRIDNRLGDRLAGPRRAGGREAAYEAFVSLLSLWDPRELDDPGALAPLVEHRPALSLIRDHFARSGGDREAALALFALAATDADRAAEYLAEIDQIFAFADELAVARHGEGAQRSRPIEILEHAVRVFPTPEVHARLVELTIERQSALRSQFRRSGADLRLIRAHGPAVLRATWSVIRSHAHAFRLHDAAAAARRVTGFGDDADLRGALERATADGDDASAWRELADAFHEAGEGDDPVAALRICQHGLDRAPGSAALHLCVAERALETDELHLAHRHYARALELDPGERAAAAQLAVLYEHRVAQLASDKRPDAAAAQLAELAKLADLARARWPDEPLDTTTADGYAAMGGGLTSIGELEAARFYLERAIADAPHRRALEHLGVIALKQERWERARRHLARALALPLESDAERFDHARLLRLAAVAARGAGDEGRARAHAETALAAWDAIERELGPLRTGYQGQMLVEIGQLRWLVGEREEALDAFERAVDADPNGAATHAAIVAFLIVRDEYRPALDVYHRALGSREIDDYFKVYMSLWVMIDAQLRGRHLDPLAKRYLERRSGRLWHDALARWVSGRTDLESLERHAQARDRLAELLYYRAMLDEMPNDPDRARELLRDVLATEMVLFFEYDMARRWLSSGFGPAR